ncbi:MAG TPA: hypothetical protein VGO09_02960 [Flavisolibacter sp.]|nr:hypothetical protein [Flavisolibacter sp.]
MATQLNIYLNNTYKFLTTIKEMRRWSPKDSKTLNEVQKDIVDSYNYVIEASNTIEWD